MLGFKEMVLDHNVTLSNETVVLVWISSANALAIVQAGYRLVHAPSDYFYLVRLPSLPLRSQR